MANPDPANDTATAASPPSRKKGMLRSLPLSQLLSLLVLIISLTVTWQLRQNAQRGAEAILETDFEYLVQEAIHRLERRMLTYEQVMRGTAGLFAASGSVSREEFRTYFNALQLKSNYPGIQGIGFAEAVTADRLAQHISRVRSEGFPEYTVYPEGSREFYSPIIYLEPFAGRNLRAFGYDMYSDPVRREAMEHSRDSGEAAISGKVILVQEVGEDVQTGFLMYLPIYRIESSHDTPEQRRMNLVGWVYAPFRMRDLMSGINAEQNGNLHLRIYDGKRIADSALMYEGSGLAEPDAGSKRFVSIQHVRILHHDWTVVASAPQHFLLRLHDNEAALIFKGGIGISVLLTLLTWLLVDERTRAWRVADHAYRLALYDALTDLPNRKLFNDRLHHALAQARRNHGRVAVMFIDLDKFKPVNDNFGHEVGDLLLKEVAGRLQKCVRESDTVARLGGDEFVVLFPYSEEERGDSVVADKILKALAAPFHIAGHALHISSSIGIAVYPSHGMEEKTLLRNADTAMYHAKSSGRNNYQFYDPQMRMDE